MKQMEPQFVVQFIKEVVTKCEEINILVVAIRTIIRQGINKKFKMLKFFYLALMILIRSLLIR